MYLKQIVIIIFFSSLVSKSLAQKVEIGLGLGPTYYKGDIQPTFKIFTPRIGSNAFFRYNFNKVLSAKANGFIGIFGGKDSKSGDPMNIQRGYSFNTKVYDYNAQLEYNFLNFRTHDGKYEHTWSPYLFGGIGQYSQLNSKFMSPSGSNNIRVSNSPNFMLPFGIGIKKILFRQFNIGLEFGTRVLLNKKNRDLFDGLGYSPSSVGGVSKIVSETYYLGVSDLRFNNSPNSVQPDKYFYFSFSVSYLFYKIYCPVSLK